MYLLREWEVERRYAPQWRVENPTSHFPLPTSHYLSFSVASPTNTSSIVMIQKRTTTWVSFQPFNS